MTTAYDGPRSVYERRRTSLEQERESWIAHWKDISSYILPRRGRFLDQKYEHNRGSKKNDSIVDGTATRACGTASAGMKGLANKSTRWFALGTPDTALAEWGPVKHWLYAAEQLLYDIFAMSNFYDALTPVFEELVAFGTAPMHIDEDPKTVIRCYPFTVGSYSLALDGHLRPDTLYRSVIFTASQLVQRFGEQRISSAVKTAWDGGQTEQKFKIVHLIEPNDTRVPSKGNSQNLPWRSVYYDPQDDEQRLLRQGGYHEFPVSSPRWWITGGDTYGTSPGMVALPDVRQLQKDVRRKGKNIELVVNPPMVAPLSMLTQRISTVPGDCTYVDATGPQHVVRPAWEANPNITPQLQNLAELRQAINETFYVDVFKMIASRVSPQMTATQVLELAGEKMLLLGPVVERAEGELLDHSIRRTLGIAMLARLLPPPPQELMLAGYNVKYISPLSLARLSSGAAAVRETAAFAAQLGEAFQGALDKFNARQAVDEFARMKAVPPSIIRTDEEVAEIDKQRQQELQRQQFAEMAERGAAGMKTLSQAQIGESNALEVMTGAGQPS